MSDGVVPSPPIAALPPRPERLPRVAHLQQWFQRNRPQVLLVVLAITIPEVLTGSTPVRALINPFSVLGLLGFYGAGVLLVRDLSIRWKNGWAGILLLGLAYGIAEEGIATKTMVDPHNSAAGFLGHYGHFLGVNWIFAVVIDLFHALFSIALPILLTELTYPETRTRRFLSDRGVRVAFLVLAFSVSLGFFAFDPKYFEGYAVLAALLGALAAFVVAARFAPGEWLYPDDPRPRISPLGFLGLGVGLSTGWFFFYIVAPFLGLAPVLCIAAELAIPLLVLFLVVRRAGRTGNELHKVYFAGGLLSWFLWWDFLVTVSGDYLVYAVLALVIVYLYGLKKRYTPRSPLTFPLGGDPDTPGTSTEVQALGGTDPSLAGRSSEGEALQSAIASSQYVSRPVALRGGQPDLRPLQRPPGVESVDRTFLVPPPPGSWQ